MTMYKYGMSHRGCSIGAQPAGFDHFEDVDKATTGFYSIVYYENELTAEQVADYELTPITDEIQTETAPEATEAAEATEAPTIETPDDLTAFINEIGLEAAAFCILKDQRNTNLIMLAGIEAGIFTADDLMKFEFYGIMPNYHTFNAWKAAGYIVKKGSKAAFNCRIWDYKTSKAGTYTAEEAAAINSMMINSDGSQVKEGDEKTHSQYYKFNAYFFGPDQVEKINYENVALPEDCTRRIEEGREIIEGNTKEIKEQLKAAGYTWHKKNKYWFRSNPESVQPEAAAEAQPEPEKPTEVETEAPAEVETTPEIETEAEPETISELTPGLKFTFNDAVEAAEFPGVNTVVKYDGFIFEYQDANGREGMIIGFFERDFSRLSIVA